MMIGKADIPPLLGRFRPAVIHALQEAEHAIRQIPARHCRRRCRNQRNHYGLSNSAARKSKVNTALNCVKLKLNHVTKEQKYG